MYDSTSSTDAQISSANILAEDEAPCTNEMLGQSKSTQLQGQYLRNTGRESYRSLLLSLIAGIIFGVLPTLYLIVEAVIVLGQKIYRKIRYNTSLYD